MKSELSTAYHQQKVGDFGQKLAKKYLLAKGYEIIGQHFYIRGGEIDLIAKIREKVIFVEVKTRTSTVFGQPEDQIDTHKKAALQRAAEVFLRTHRLLGTVEFCFDVIAIILNVEQKKAKIRHFKDIQMY